MTSPSTPLDAVTHPDPYTYYASLREAGPVHRFAGVAAWFVVGTQAMAAVLNHPPARVRPPVEPVPGFLRGTAAGQVFAALARMTDGPAHYAARALLLALMQRWDASSLTRAAVRAAEVLGAAEPVHRSAAGLDEFIRGLPVTAMSALLGWPESAWGETLAATGAWVGGLSPLATPVQQAAAIDAMDRLLVSFESFGVDRPEDAAAHLALLMQAHEATAGLMGAGLLRLARDAELRAAAMTGRLAWPTFGAEVLRHDPPVHNTRRTLAEDLVLGGHRLQAGDTVVLVLAAAARDPALVDAPGEFRLDRPLRAGGSSGHWTLGTGPHACPGGDVALVIAEAGWRWIVEHRGGADWRSLVDHVSWRPSLNARLPVFASPA